MCGIIGAYGIKDAILALVAGANIQQQRGHDSSGGIVFFDDPSVEPVEVRKLGRVGDVFTELRVNRMKGARYGLVHCRYSTAGSAFSKRNNQPFTADFHGPKGECEILTYIHNGNFTDPFFGRMMTTSDSELISKGFETTNSQLPIEERIFQTLRLLHGAFSLLFLYRNGNGKISLIVARDPQGIRPLCYAKCGDGYIFASESVALTIIPGVKFEGFVQPGEIIVVDEDGLRSYRPLEWQNQRKAFCIFELIYFMHPCSLVETDNGHLVYIYQIRRALGARLQQMAGAPTNLDVICSMPNSGNPHAEGAAVAFDVPFELDITRNDGSGRTFIAPEGLILEAAEGKVDERTLKVLRKFGFYPNALANQVVGIVDDSIVRGLTMRVTMKLLRYYNGDLIKAIYVLVASAPIRYPCFWGINIASRSELAIHQAQGDVETLSSNLGVDSVTYLTVSAMVGTVSECTGKCGQGYCTACFTHEAPTSILNPVYEREWAS